LLAGSEMVELAVVHQGKLLGKFRGDKILQDEAVAVLPLGLRNG
jgi:hypothetical protein